MRENPPLPAFPLGRAVCALAGIAFGAAALVTAALWMAGRGGGLAELWVAASVCVVAAVVALLPVWGAGRNVQAIGMAALGGSVIRVAFTVVLVAACAVAAPGLEAASLAVWALVWYLLLLVAELTLIIRHLQTIEQAMKERVA